jgi:MFS-type transporter involved in bile tolerance (Atg22 family)
MIAGPVIAGVLYDVTDSYAAGFTVLALLAGLGGLLLAAARAPTGPGAGQMRGAAHVVERQ